MTFTNKTESAMTVASVTAELEALETHYKSRKKKLKALLAVLVDEEADARTKRVEADAAGKGATDVDAS